MKLIGTIVTYIDHGVGYISNAAKNTIDITYRDQSGNEITTALSYQKAFAQGTVICKNPKDQAYFVKCCQENWCSRCNCFDINAILIKGKRYCTTCQSRIMQHQNASREIYIRTLKTQTAYNLQNINTSLFLNRSSSIQTKQNTAFRIHGKFYPPQKVLFIDEKTAHQVKRILIDNKNAKDITLDGKNYSNFSREKRERAEYERKQELQKKKEQEIQSKLYREQQAHQARLQLMKQIPSSVAVITIECKSGKVTDYLIVSNPRDTNRMQNIFHYSDDLSRELLAAIHHPEIQNNPLWENKQIKITHPIGKTDWNLRLNIPCDVYIGRDGGFSSSVREGKRFLIDIFLYSPFSRRYEIVKATYDYEHDYCFIDISKYRHFINTYGNPQVKLYPVNNTCKNPNNWNDLNDESLLKTYGYNVSRKESLPDVFRHELLAEIVDLNIMTVSRIIYMLNYFITAHPGNQNYEARQKWRDDIAFIEHYRVNTDRFLIAKKVKR